MEWLHDGAIVTAKVADTTGHAGGPRPAQGAVPRHRQAQSPSPARRLDFDNDSHSDGRQGSYPPIPKRARAREAHLSTTRNERDTRQECGHGLAAHHHLRRLGAGSPLLAQGHQDVIYPSAPVHATLAQPAAGADALQDLRAKRALKHFLPPRAIS